MITVNDESKVGAKELLEQQLFHANQQLKVANSTIMGLRAQIHGLEEDLWNAVYQINRIHEERNIYKEEK